MSVFAQRHLLGIEPLSAAELETILGWAHRLRGDWDEAFAHYRRAAHGRRSLPVPLAWRIAEAHYLRVILPDKIRLARHYVARHSVLLDLKLVAETVLVLAYPATAVEGMFDRLAPRHRLVTGFMQSALAAVSAVAALRLR